jgi:hypothetical protein
MPLLLAADGVTPASRAQDVRDAVVSPWPVVGPRALIRGDIIPARVRFTTCNCPVAIDLHPPTGYDVVNSSGGGREHHTFMGTMPDVLTGG